MFVVLTSLDVTFSTR